MRDEDFLALADPATRAALAGAERLDLTQDLTALRRETAVLVAATAQPLPEGLTQGDVVVPGGPRVRVTRPAEPVGTIVWVHGGGFLLGSLDGSDLHCRTLAQTHRARVVSVDYRLAPEHPAPAAIEDCHAALDWAFADTEGPVVLAGGSAGAGLAAATTLRVREHGGRQPNAQVLHYPMLDDRAITPSSREVTFAGTWHRSANEIAWQHYLSGRDDLPAYVVPARVDDLAGLPPTFLDVGTLDLFRDEDIAFAQRLMACGVPTDLVVTAGAWHGSELLCPDAPSSQAITAARHRAYRHFLTD